MKPKILLLDIETAPNLGYTWGKWEQDVIEFAKDWYILCYCAKWLGQTKILSAKLPDFSEFKKDKTNDFYVVRELWKLFDEADIIIAHNGDQFDIKKSNARFVTHKLQPPSPYKTIDTKKIAKRYFKFDSNKLDELGRYLGLGRKLPHTGKALWLGCMNGDHASWKKMMEYNKQDVLLLQRIYLRLRAWEKNHPDTSAESLGITCKNCGSTHLQSRGYNIAKGTAYILRTQKFQCRNCGAWRQGTSVKVPFK